MLWNALELALMYNWFETYSQSTYREARQPMIKGSSCRARTPCFPIPTFQNCLAVWPHINYSLSLCFSFLTCESKVIYISWYRWTFREGPGTEVFVASVITTKDTCLVFPYVTSMLCIMDTYLRAISWCSIYYTFCLSYCVLAHNHTNISPPF